MTTTSAPPTQPLRPHAGRNGRRRRRILRRWITRGFLAVLGAGLLASIVYAWLPKPVAVDDAVVKRGPLVVEVDEDGQTRVRDRFVVSAPISGDLQRIELEPGAAVTPTDVVARIDPPAPALLDQRTRSEAAARLSASIAHERSAATAIARARVARDAAVRDADRARTLAQRGAIAATEREHAELAEQLAIRDLAAAESQLAAARAETAAARAVLGQGSGSQGGSTVAVTAPVAGEVLRVVRDSAGPVAAGAPLLEVGDTHTLEVVVDVLSSDAARIRPGMSVEIDAWGGDHALHGIVLRVEPSAFTRISALGVEEQRVKVITTLDAPPATLGDGFRVEARIVIWRGEQVLTVPASAVFRDRGRWAVFTIVDGRARLQPIEIGHRGRLDVEVTRGLAAGARVVLHPSDAVGDGVRVEAR